MALNKEQIFNDICGKKRCKKYRDNIVNLSCMYAWTHTSKTRRSGRNGRKPISLQQIAFSAASMTLSFGLYACLTMCISSMCVCETVHHCACTVPPFVLPCATSVRLHVHMRVSDYIYLCACVCVCVCHSYWHQALQTSIPSNPSQHRCDAQGR